MTRLLPLIELMYTQDLSNRILKMLFQDNPSLIVKTKVLRKYAHTCQTGSHVKCSHCTLQYTGPSHVPWFKIHFLVLTWIDVKTLLFYDNAMISYIIEISISIYRNRINIFDTCVHRLIDKMGKYVLFIEEQNNGQTIGACKLCLWCCPLAEQLLLCLENAFLLFYRG